MQCVWKVCDRNRLVSFQTVWLWRPLCTRQDTHTPDTSHEKFVRDAHFGRKLGQNDISVFLAFRLLSLRTLVELMFCHAFIRHLKLDISKIK